MEQPPRYIVKQKKARCKTVCIVLYLLSYKGKEMKIYGFVYIKKTKNVKQYSIIYY